MNDVITKHRNLWPNLAHSSLIEWYDNVSNKELNQLLLSGKSKFDLPSKFLVLQAESFKKIKAKAPNLGFQKGLVFPQKNNVEQCSSEYTAKFKAEFLAEIGVKKVIDVTGGWGIDAIYFSQCIQDVVHVEMDSPLQEIADYNFKQLGLNIESLATDFRELPKTALSGRWVYADPMRRKGGDRILGWEGQSPNPQELIDLVNSGNCEGLLLKLSPMDDLQWVKRQIPDGLNSSFHVVEVGTELKEVLLLISSPKGYIGGDQVVFIARPGGETSKVQQKDFQNLVLDEYDKTYLYLARPAMNKMGWGDSLQTVPGLDLLSNGFFKGVVNVKTEAYRKFEVLEVLPGSFKKLKKRFSKSDLHVISKGFDFSADQIQGQLALKPKGDKYLILTGDKKERSAYLAKSI